MILKTDLIEAMVDAVAGGIADMETGEILYASRLLEEMFGYMVRGELSGMNVDILVPSSLRQRHTEHRKDYASTPEPRPMGVGLQVDGQRKDSSLFPVTVTLSGVVLSGRRCVVFIVFNMMDPRRYPPVTNAFGSYRFPPGVAPPVPLPPATPPLSPPPAPEPTPVKPTPRKGH